MHRSASRKPVPLVAKRRWVAWLASAAESAYARTQSPRHAVALTAATVAWGGLYVLRTSSEIDGESAFMLWGDGMISIHFQ